MSWVVRRPSQAARSEVLLLLALVPLCQCTSKAAIDPRVTASDASEIGLGLSRSVRLSPASETFARALRRSFGANAAVLPSLPGEKAGPRLFMVSLFDGIGGLRRAAERLSLPVPLCATAEMSAQARRVVTTAWPGTLKFSDARELDRLSLAPLFNLTV